MERFVCGNVVAVAVADRVRAIVNVMFWHLLRPDGTH
jgi:hypothetical protein